MTEVHPFGAEWFGEAREYAIRDNVVYVRFGDEKTWRIDRETTEWRRSRSSHPAGKATSSPTREGS